MISHFMEKVLLLIVLIFFALHFAGFDKKTFSSMLVSSAGGVLGLMLFEGLDTHLFNQEREELRAEQAKDKADKTIVYYHR